MQITHAARALSALALSVLLGGILTGCATSEPTATPETAVTKYFEYLEDKDLNAVMEATSYDVVKELSETHVAPPEVLEKIETLTDFKLENVQTGAASAIANVTYKVAGKQIKAGIDLINTGDSETPIWLVNETLPIIGTDSLTNSVSSLEGQTVSGNIIVVPGVYEVTVSSADEMFEDLNATVSVTMDEPYYYLSEIFDESDKKYTSKWLDAVNAAWTEYEPTLVMESQRYGDSAASAAAFEAGEENMVRLVKSPTVSEVVWDDEESEWVAKLVDGEWERYTKTGTTEGRTYRFDNTYGFQNQGNVVTGFSFYYDDEEGGIQVLFPEFADDPNEEQ